MAQVTEKNGTPQAPNFDFEVWDKDYKLWGWNSSTEAEFDNSPSSENRHQSLWKSNDKRPGSKGNTSAYIKVTQSDWYHYKFPFGTRSYEQMGTITTGVPYYYDDKRNGATCMYTNTGTDSKRWSFNGRPDSIVFWAKAGLNGGRNSDMTLYLHNNAKLEDRAYPNTAKGTVIGKANVKISGNTWKRYSAPIVYERGDNPSYLLLSFTAGNNFREVVEGDELWVDDVMMIYNPRLRINLENQIAMPVRKNEAYPKLNVPFTLSGTMNPFNLEDDNVVYAELSDENGSFENPRILSSITTETSGMMEIQIPKDLNIYNGTQYKLRLRATNYPILSENIISLDIFYQYQLTINAQPAWATNLSVDMILREGEVYTASFGNVMTGLHFSSWMSNDQNMGNAPAYAITMDQDYVVNAVFDTNYYLLTAWGGLGGRIAVDGRDVETDAHFSQDLIHNATPTFAATNDFGYHFKEWQLDGAFFSTTNPLQITLTEAVNLEAVFDTNVYELLFTAVPDNMGTASGSGAYKHFTAASSTALAAEYAQFKHWRKAGETEVISYEPTLSIELVDKASAYEAVFASQTFNVSTAASPAEHGLTFGDATYEAFPITAQAQVEATPHAGYHFTHWTCAINGQNQAERILDNPYIFAENTHIAQNYAFTAHFEIDRYNLTAQAEHGMVTGLGTFDYNTEVTLTATPDYGYAFKGWFKGEELLGSETVLSFPLTEDLNLTAKFAPIAYPFTFAVRGDQTLGRIIQPAVESGSYEHFSRLTLIADAAEGNEFRYWIINDDDTVASTATYTLDVNGPNTVEAVFSPLRKQLTLLNPTPNMGSVSSSGLYEHGAAVSLSAEVRTGYLFKGWLLSADNILYTENPLNIAALNEHRTYTAVFEPIQYPICLTNAMPDMGDVLLNGAAVEASAEACTHFPYLSMVELKAIPTAGHRFMGWINPQTQDTLLDNPLSFSAREDLSLTAIFDLVVFNVQAAAYPTEAASMSGNGFYYQDTEVTLTASPNAGFEFEGWYNEQGEKLPDETPELSLTVSQDVYYVARFNRINYTISVVAEPADFGEVTGGGATPYHYNAKVEAVAKEGRQFNGWYDANGELVSQQAVYYPLVSQDETLTARFGLKTLNISLACNPTEAGLIQVPGQTEKPVFFYDQAVQFQAVANEGYRFSHWTDQEGNTLGEAAIYDLTPTTDLQLTAHFVPQTFKHNLSVKPAEAGVLSGMSEEVAYGQVCTATVTPSDEMHYFFVGWTDAKGRILSSDPTYTFTFRNEPLVAQFEGITVKVNVSVEDEKTGKVDIEGTPRYAETITATATPARGHRFIGWFDNTKSEQPAGEAAPVEDPAPENQTSSGKETNSELPLSEEPVLVRVLTGNLNLLAKFKRETYPLAVTALPQNGGQVVYPTHAIAFEDMATLHATANEGYRFVAYEKADGQILSYEPTYTLSVVEALSLNARFEPLSYTLKAVSADKTLGQTKGSGLFTYGQTTTIKAWATAPGYRFSHWSSNPEGNDTLSTQAEWTYTITAENRVVYACFQLKTLHLALTANLPQAGELRGGGDKTYGESVTISATTRDGYLWKGFSEHEMLLTEEATYTFVLTENRQIVGVFAPKVWTVKAFDLPDEVRVKGEGTYNHNSEATLEAILPVGLELVSWEDQDGKIIGHENPLRLTIEGNLNIKPVCALRRLPLVVEFEPAGAGVMLTEGFTDNQAAFPYNEQVSLQVEAAHGYTFVGWQEDGVFISHENPYLYNILGESRLKAVFQREGWVVATGVNVAVAGSTSGDGIYPQGETVEVTATPNPGFEFAYWAENGENVSTEATYRFVADKNRTLMANFQIRYYQILAEANPVISAKVSGSGKYSAHDTVTLSVIMNGGYEFIGWEYEGEILSSSRTYRFVPEGDMYIVARTQKLTAGVSVVSSPMEGGTVKGCGEYRMGSAVTLIAEPNDGYEFSYWADTDMNVLGFELTYNFTITDDTRLVAVFEQKAFTDEEPHIVLYPLPFKDEVHLVGENISDITWYNAFGVQVAHYDVHAVTHTVLHADQWPRGIYTYRVRLLNRREVKGKAIKF